MPEARSPIYGPTVAVPDFQTLMRPLLAETEDGTEHAIAEIRDVLAEQFTLTDADLAERISSGRARKFQNRVGWAATYLYHCGLLEWPRRAHYKITDRGRQVLGQNPDRVDLAALRQFPEFDEFTRQPPRTDGRAGDGTGPEETETPAERIEAAYQELRSALVDNVLERVREQSWQFFEDLVLRVLRAMGYGGPRGTAEHLGQSGDQGVDGVVREDALGFDLIHVQAKKWANNVQRPDVHRFYGALTGQRATKGVFITTSAFSPQAREYAESVTPRIILIDGHQLAELMIDHGVGVAVEQSYEIKRLDLDFFIEDENEGS